MSQADAASAVLPSVREYHFDPPLDIEGEMEFRIIYRGPLPSGSGDSRVKYKHAIRKQIHSQIKELFRQHGWLRVNQDALAENHEKFGFRFVPLVPKSDEITAYTCALDILFLRRDSPGNLIVSRGDIDNRIKTLLDGLKIPDSKKALGDGVLPEQGEDPFFCLLEDDYSITDIRILTDRLLTPIDTASEEREGDVVLILRVTVRGGDFSFLAD